MKKFIVALLLAMSVVAPGFAQVGINFTAMNMAKLFM